MILKNSCLLTGRLPPLEMGVCQALFGGQGLTKPFPLSPRHVPALSLVWLWRVCSGTSAFPRTLRYVVVVRRGGLVIAPYAPRARPRRVSAGLRNPRYQPAADSVVIRSPASVCSAVVTVPFFRLFAAGFAILLLRYYSRTKRISHITIDKAIAMR